MAGDLERVECGFELVATTADIFLRSLDEEYGVFRNKVAGFVGELAVNTDRSRENKALRLLAAFRQTAHDELSIKTVTHGCSLQAHRAAALAPITLCEQLWRCPARGT